jgi:hypothetical protein
MATNLAICVVATESNSAVYLQVLALPQLTPITPAAQAVPNRGRLQRHADLVLRSGCLSRIPCPDQHQVEAA